MQQSRNSSRVGWVYVLILFFARSLATAQATYGSIVGQVVDASGAAIPNATVTVTDVAKGTVLQVTTNGSGEYLASHLIPDAYTIKAVATGFRTTEVPDIQVAADTSPKVNLQLAVGAENDVVEVTTENPQLKTDRADVAAVFNQKTIQDLPISGRNFASLELLIPGAQAMGWSQNSAEDAQGSPTVNISGQSFSGVEYQLDGAANQDPILGQIVVNPPLDAVAEAKISTQAYDAEFGQSTAAVVSAQTKSGTNALHGDAFLYRRSAANLARNPYSQYAPFSSTSSRIIPPALFSQFGGSLGGPIRKDKIFVFGDYQGVRQRIGASLNETVPTALMHNSCLSGNGCDLSEYLAGRGPLQGQIYNPRVIDPKTGPAPFANNFIPNQYLSPQSLYLLKLIPLPNAPGTQNGTANNYNGGGNGTTNQNQFDVRVDYQIKEAAHAFGRYSYFDNKLADGTVFGAGGGAGFGNTFGGSAAGRNQSAVAGVDLAITPKLLTDFRLGYLRYHVATQKFDGAAAFATAAGIPGLNTGTSFTGGAPGFFPSDGLSSFGSSLQVNACNCALLETEDQYQVVNNWTRIFGNHTLKAGIDLRYARNLRVPSDENRAGELSFNSTDTENTNIGTPGGSGFATFLLGDVTYFQRYVSTSTNAKETQHRIFSYAQDNWRVTPNLTVNLGVRWELYLPETVNGKAQGGIGDLSIGAIRVAGVGPYSESMGSKVNYKTIGPRIGIAYQVTPTTVIRSGYGRSFDIGVFGSVFGHVATQNLPVLANQNLTSSGANSYAFNLNTGPQAFTFPSVPTTGLLPIPNGLNAKLRENPQQLPTVDAWNLSLQQQVNKTLSLTLSYVANKGTHGFAGDGQTTNPNEVAACLSPSQSSTGQGLCWSPSAPAGSLTQTSNTQLLRPFYAKYGWTQDQTFYHDGFDTHYNSLQTALEKRFAQGLQFTARYSWQRGFNYGGDYSEIDRKVNYGQLDDLRQQEFQFYGNYALPFGRNRMFLQSSPAWVNQVVGGFELSTSMNLSSGLPFTPSYGECGSDIPSGPCRPSKGAGTLPTKLGGFNPMTHQRTFFTPVAAFSANGATSGPFIRPGVDQFGTVQRNSYSGPGIFTDDVSLLKDLTLKDNLKLQFRIDAFNAFNHISAANPSACIDCVGQGVITGPSVQPRQLEFSSTITF